MILITGNKGYIGTNYIDRFPDKLEHVGCDVKDGQNFRNYTIKSNNTAVLHLASSVSVEESVLHPMAYFDNNVYALLEFIEANKNKIGRFVFTSTGGAIYGNSVFASEGEASWKTCFSPYAQSKYIAEDLIRRKIPNHCILRLGNVYGGNSSVRGEASVHTHFEKDDPIVVYGGEQTRDFIHISQVVESINKALSSDIVGTFNIGSGKSTKIKFLATQFSINRGVKVVNQPSRRYEVSFITLNCDEAKKVGLL